jgi:hypothetical protein
VIRALPILAAALLALAGQAAAGDRLTYELGPLLPGEYHSSGYASGRWWAGEYAPEQPAVVAWSDGEGRNWDSRRAVSPGPHESVSAILEAGDEYPAGQALALTESPAAAYLVTDSGEMMAVTIWDQFLYAFAGPSARRLRMVCLGNNYGPGGRVARIGGGWPYLTPAAYDEAGWPLLIWDAVIFQGRLVIGCARARGRYREHDAGRVLVMEHGAWRVTPLRAGGVVQAAVLDLAPGWLIACTAWGEIWRTRDLETWERCFHGPHDADIRIYEAGGHTWAVSAAGEVYRDWHQSLALAIPGARRLSVAQRTGQTYWAGPVTLRGEHASRTVVIRPVEDDHDD